jgi:hypothetical protein
MAALREMNMMLRRKQSRLSPKRTFPTIVSGMKTWTKKPVESLRLPDGEGDPLSSFYSE